MDTCCCCIPLETGVVVIAVYEMIAFGISTISSFSMGAGGFTGGSGGLSIWIFIAAILLFIGARKRNRGLILGWMIATGIRLVLEGLGLILLIVLMAGVLSFPFEGHDRAQVEKAQQIISIVLPIVMVLVIVDMALTIYFFVNVQRYRARILQENLAVGGAYVYQAPHDYVVVTTKQGQV